MSRFETGSLSNRGRNEARLPDTPLQSVQLAVPGLDVPPPVVQRSSLASSMLQAFGLAENTSGILANGVERQLGYERQVVAAQDYASEQARMDAERNRTIAENYGRSTIASVQPLIVSRIAESTALLTDEQISEQAKKDILDRTSGLDQVSVDAALRHATPSIVKAYTDRREQLRAVAKQNATEAIYSGTIASTEPDKFVASVDALASLHPEQSRDTIAQDLQSKAIAYQSKYGTRDGLDRALAFTSNVDPFVKSKAEYDFAERQQRAEAAVNQESDNFLSGLLNDARDGKTSLEAVEKMYRAKFGGVVNSEKIRQGLSLIDSAKAKQATELAKMNDDFVRKSVVQAASSDASAAALASNGGVWMLDANKGSYKGVLSDGKEYKLSDGELKDIQQQAVDAAAESIRKSNASNPDRAFADTVDLMARNKMPTTELSSLLNNAHAVASIDTLAPDRMGDGKPKATEAPPQLIAAIMAYSRTKNQNAQVAAFTVKDDKARALYDTVDFLKTLPEYRQQPNENDAMWTGRVTLDAVTALDRAAWHGFGGKDNGIADVKVAEAIESSGSRWNIIGLGEDSLSDAKNSQYVHDAIRARAQFFMASRMVGEDKAIEAAIKSFRADHEKVKGAWIDFRELGINKDALSLATSLVAQEYVKQDAKLNTTTDESGKETVNDSHREYTDPSQLALVPDNHGGWVLADATLLSPVLRQGAGTGRFTTADLLNMIAADGARRAASEAPKRAEDLRFISAKQQAMQYSIRQFKLESDALEMKLYKKRLAESTNPDEQAAYQAAIASLQDRIDGKVPQRPEPKVVPARITTSGEDEAKRSSQMLVRELEKRRDEAKTDAEKAIVQDTIDRMDELNRGMRF